MFDRPAFSAALDRVVDLLKHLGAGAEFRFGTLGLDVTMNGRGVPKAFVDAITSAAETAQPSNHARMRFKQIMAGELATALKDLRQLYAGASGGLANKVWRQGVIRFVLANGGSVGATWIIPDFAPNYELKATIPLPSDPSQLAVIARRLELHSRLPLAGTPRLYELGEKGNQLSPFCVAAPDPGLALARLITLTGMDARKFTHVREVISAEGAAAQAKMHMQSAKHAEEAA